MAVFTIPLDTPFAGSAVTCVVTRAATQLGSAVAARTQLASGLWVASATVDLAAAGAGPVTATFLGLGQLAGIVDATIDASGVVLAGATSADVQSIVVASTSIPTAEQISDDRTFKFPSVAKNGTSPNYVIVKKGQAGPVTVAFDLSEMLPAEVVISSVTSATIANTGATVGTPVRHTSFRKVNVPLTNINTTAGDYKVTLTVVATDSEQYQVDGILRAV